MLPEYEKALREAARVPAPGGLLTCSCPVTGLHEGFDLQWEKIAGTRGLHSLSEGKLKTLCEKNGLSYDRAGTNGGVLYFTAGKTPQG